MIPPPAVSIEEAKSVATSHLLVPIADDELQAVSLQDGLSSSKLDISNIESTEQKASGM